MPLKPAGGVYTPVGPVSPAPLTLGVRMLPDGRLHGSAHGPSFGAEPEADWRRVDARIRRLFPQLGAMRWQQAWSGWVAMTTDHFPRLHELAPGLYAGLGYNGRGIAAATMMGRDLATLVRGARDDATVFPLTPLRPLGRLASVVPPSPEKLIATASEPRIFAERAAPTATE